MKYTIIIPFLLINLWCFSQTNGDNVILVKNVSFTQLCNSLLDSGYVISKKDVDLQTLSTEMRKYKKSFNAGYVVHARVKDGDLQLRVNFFGPLRNFTTELLNPRNPIDSYMFDNLRGYYALDKKGRFVANNIYTVPFKYIMDFARGFNQEIQYSKD